MAAFVFTAPLPEEEPEEDLQYPTFCIYTLVLWQEASQWNSQQACPGKWIKCSPSNKWHDSANI